MQQLILVLSRATLPLTPLPTNNPEITLAMDVNAFMKDTTSYPPIRHNATSHPLIGPWTNEKRQTLPTVLKQSQTEIKTGEELNKNLKKAQRLSRDKVLMEVMNKHHFKRKIETIVMESKTSSHREMKIMDPTGSTPKYDTSPESSISSAGVVSTMEDACTHFFFLFFL